jgi:pimeloyl-ACP methyl ester carboxylesterase
MAKEYTLKSSVGNFSTLDFGGIGDTCLLLHGTGQNAEAWRDVATILSTEYRTIAIDMRGHGQTTENSNNSEHYWRDIGPIIEAFDLESPPILIGHSSGGYAATAYSASGGECLAIVSVDGFTLDDKDSYISQANQWNLKDLATMFRYGWMATSAERDAYIQQVLDARNEDWLNKGVDKSLLKRMLMRCFLQKDNSWIRRPTLDEIVTISTPQSQATILPTLDLYDKVKSPLALIFATHGLTAHRKKEVEAIAEARPNRIFRSINANHNVPMQQPDKLAHIIMSSLSILLH